MGFWAHARRKFVDAVKVNPKDAEAIKMVTRMDALFVVDRHLGHTPRSKTQNNRSERRVCTRLVRRFKTINCCLKATISSPKSLRDRIKLPSHMNTPQISPSMNPFL